MRLIAFLEYVAVIIGSVGMVAGQYFGLAKGFHLGVFVAGAGMIAAAYLLDNDQWQSTVNYLMRRPAPLLGTGGLFVIGIGVLMMLNPQGRSSWIWRILVYFPRVLLGLLVAAAGIAIIGLGVWEWLEPQA